MVRNVIRTSSSAPDPEQGLINLPLPRPSQDHDQVIRPVTSPVRQWSGAPQEDEPDFSRFTARWWPAPDDARTVPACPPCR